MILRFGKFKGQHLDNTPDWYQKWLRAQEWFKEEKALYEVVRKFNNEYIRGVGQRYEVMHSNMEFETAKAWSESLNMTEMCDMTDYFFVRPQRYN